jgi:nucleoside-diphosphate-sugar epimerase
MRVVITGATGNVGTSVVERLAQDDAAVTEIVGVARRGTDWSPPKTRWVQADILVDDLEAVFRGADAVVHLAWIFQPTHNPLATWRNNVLGAIRVFDAVAAAGVGALIHASSIGAYSPGPDHEPVDESWPTHALSTAAYGREKSYVERVLDIFERDHPQVRVVRLRPGFIFKRSSAEEQRRLFAGPLLPNSLVRPGLIPVMPDLPGLRLQALHARDAAQAYHLALTRDVRGPFNVAAEPVLDAQSLARLLGARVVHVPLLPVRAALAAAWRLHLVPASPQLLDLALSLPVMDTTRATTELGWTQSVDALSAVGEVIEGMRQGAGGQTPPLRSDAGGRLRHGELASGVGEQGGVSGEGR